MPTTVIDSDRSFLGHPKGLAVLFFTEMWERFSYYGMKALLTIYLVEHFLFTDKPAYEIVAAYIALAYVTPVLGGYVADRYLGFRRAVLLGGILIMCGHIGMALEGAEAKMAADGGVARDSLALQVLFFSLALIVVGTGLLKSSISSMVGGLYAKNDVRRDAGFTIFYMGINLGAFLAPIICGVLASVYGWSYGFGAAAVGMAAGLITLTAWRRPLAGCGDPPDLSRLLSPVFGPVTPNHLVIAATLLTILPVWFLVQSADLVGNMLGGTVVGALIITGVYASMRLEPMDRDRIFVVLLLFPFSVLFWAFFEQMGLSFALFALRVVDLQILGLGISAPQIQSINPAFIFLLAPLIAWLWVRLGKAGREPRLPVKYALALLQLGLGFAVISFGASITGDGVKVPLIWLTLGLLLHTTGELCISPVGLSAVTKLSPTRMVGYVMGIWFLTNSAANFAAGQIAQLTSIDTAPGAAIDITQAVGVYGSAFATMAIWPIVGAGAILLIAPLINRWMHGIR